MWTCKEPRMAKITLKKTKLEDLTLPDSRLIIKPA